MQLATTCAFANDLGMELDVRLSYDEHINV
jgi:hypothetical protein